MDGIISISQERFLPPLKKFCFGGVEQSVSFVETMKVADGVECDVYVFNNDAGKDLGIIRIVPGCKTPLQRVLGGDKTIEGYLAGEGRLTIVGNDGKEAIYPISDDSGQSFSVIVSIGETMQWKADKESGLVVYEICFPPYKEGRYENLG